MIILNFLMNWYMFCRGLVIVLHGLNEHRLVVPYFSIELQNAWFININEYLDQPSSVFRFLLIYEYIWAALTAGDTATLQRSWMPMDLRSTAWIGLVSQNLISWSKHVYTFGSEFWPSLFQDMAAAMAYMLMYIHSMLLSPIW